MRKGDLQRAIELQTANIEDYEGELMRLSMLSTSIVDLTMFVVDWAPERKGEVVDGLDRAAGRLGSRPVPPATLIGVAALAAPEYLVELMAVAVLP